MKNLGEKTETFIVRLWVETRMDATKAPVSRGSIENVRTGEKRFFLNLAEILLFILPYLQAMGGSVNFFSRLILRLLGGSGSSRKRKLS